MKAGIELELPTQNCYADPLRKALEQGEINLEYVDRAVHIFFRRNNELGLFDNPYVDEGRRRNSSKLRDQRSLALEIARKSMVLLKMMAFLPLNPRSGTIVVIGPNADDAACLIGGYSYSSMLELMTGSYQGAGRLPKPMTAPASPPCHSSTDRFIRAEETAPSGIHLYIGLRPPLRGSIRISQAVRLAQQADAVVLVLGDLSGLTPPCTTGETRDSAN